MKTSDKVQVGVLVFLFGLIMFFTVLSLYAFSFDPSDNPFLISVANFFSGGIFTEK